MFSYNIRSLAYDRVPHCIITNNDDNLPLRNVLLIILDSFHIRRPQYSQNCKNTTFISLSPEYFSSYVLSTYIYTHIFQQVFKHFTSVHRCFQQLSRISPSFRFVMGHHLRNNIANFSKLFKYVSKGKATRVEGRYTFPQQVRKGDQHDFTCSTKAPPRPYFQISGDRAKLLENRYSIRRPIRHSARGTCSWPLQISSTSCTAPHKTNHSPLVVSASQRCVVLKCNENVLSEHSLLVALSHQHQPFIVGIPTQTERNLKWCGVARFVGH